jgi:superfamily II DNA or RNA helicase
MPRVLATTSCGLARLHEISDLKKFEKLLDRHDRYSVDSTLSGYKYFTASKIDRVGFQTAAVRNATKTRKGLWCGEIAVGAGKTIIAARMALAFLRRGKKVIYVCPSDMALGGIRFNSETKQFEGNGIISEFHRVFEQEARGKFQIGTTNDSSPVNDMFFFTPIVFSRMKDSEDVIDRKLFSTIVSSAGLMIVDESHHFPDDDSGDLKVFNQIYKIAGVYFKHKRVATLTGTHGRMDGKRVWKDEADFKFPIQRVVNVGRCPDIYWAQVYLGGVDFSKSKLAGVNYELGLKKSDRERYWDLVTGVMSITWKRYKKPMCAFVRLVEEAKLLAKKFNKKTGLGDRGMVALTMETTDAERQKLIADIRDGQKMGYITVGVGSESINIPSLEIVHLIRRSKSSNRNIQSIGRALRMIPGKKRCLVINYQVEKTSIIKACVGISDFAKKSGSVEFRNRKEWKSSVVEKGAGVSDFAKKSGSITHEEGEFVNGGPVTARKKIFRRLPADMTLAEEELMITRICDASGDKKTWDYMYGKLVEFKDVFGHVNVFEVVQQIKRGVKPEEMIKREKIKKLKKEKLLI